MLQLGRGGPLGPTYQLPWGTLDIAPPRTQGGWQGARRVGGREGRGGPGVAKNSNYHKDYMGIWGLWPILATLGYFGRFWFFLAPGGLYPRPASPKACT